MLTLVDLRERSLGEELVSAPESRPGHPHRRRTRPPSCSAPGAPTCRCWPRPAARTRIIVTPSADLDLAVADVVKSAFGHAGQKCSAASLVILVGSVARSQRFERQLVDAATSLRVGYPTDPTTQMGPIIEPANGKLKDALTTLGEGERWLLEPKQLDDSGQLWSPGIRTGVANGSYFHLTEFFGPVLGVMHAETLEEAIQLQNASAYGLTAGLHSLDPEELRIWLAGVEAGNLYVNRGITGAIVRRQPFGGWKRSSVGAGTKAGGPNYLIHLGSWQPDVAPDGTQVELAPAVQSLLTAASTSLESEGAGVTSLVRNAAASDQAEWVREFGVAKDVSGLGLERNLFRYLPLPVTVRLSEGAALSDLVRIVAAGVRAGAPMHVSSAVVPSDALFGALRSVAVSVRVESDSQWHERLAAGELATTRIRLIGGNHAAASAAISGNPDVAIYADPVVPAGRIELLTFLREQAVSITAHRFGNPDDWSRSVI